MCFCASIILPVQPMAGETEQQYNRRLSQLVETLTQSGLRRWDEWSFKYHTQTFTFGATELAGLKIFLNAAANAARMAHSMRETARLVTWRRIFRTSNFTIQAYRKKNMTRRTVAGRSLNWLFRGLPIGHSNFDAYLPVSANHPNASERFRHPAVAGSPMYADLGLWNVYLNPDIPNPQTNLSTVVCAIVQNCAVDQGLATTIAQFKTPTLRDGEDSQPYFHNGSNEVSDVVEFYIKSSQLAHRAALRNAPLEFQGMSLSRTTWPRWWRSWRR